VEAYALKELKISPQRLVSLTTGLRALKRVHDVLEVTTVNFWYDSEWRSKPVPGDPDLVLGEYSFKIPLQLRWATDQRLISVEILSAALCCQARRSTMERVGSNFFFRNVVFRGGQKSAINYVGDSSDSRRIV